MNKKPQIWKDQIKDKHTWAFYYYCKRKGDKIKIIDKGNKINLIIWTKKEQKN